MRLALVCPGLNRNPPKTCAHPKVAAQHSGSLRDRRTRRDQDDDKHKKAQQRDCHHSRRSLPKSDAAAQSRRAMSAVGAHRIGARSGNMACVAKRKRRSQRDDRDGALERFGFVAPRSDWAVVLSVGSGISSLRRRVLDRRRARLPLLPSDDARINNRIRARPVELIGVDGARLGVKAARDARALAQQAGLDLVEIMPRADPPVCKIMDFARVKANAERRRANRRKPPDDDSGDTSGDREPRRPIGPPPGRVQDHADE